MSKHLVCLALLALTWGVFAPSARADDEGSEHSVQLAGAADDTLGVTVRYRKTGGWAMDLRPKAGARVRKLSLPFLPADHAHYWAVVAPKRASVTFVMSSRGALTPTTPAVWIVSARGALIKMWRLGDLLTAAQIRTLPRSISHVSWLSKPPALNRSTIVLATPHGAARIDPKRARLHGRARRF